MSLRDPTPQRETSKVARIGWLGRAVPLPVLLTGCGALVGIDQSYSVADAGPDRQGVVADGSIPRDRDSAPDARSRSDAPKDQASPPHDAPAPHDTASSGDATSPQSDADSCVDECGCPTGMVQCGTRCVDVSSDLNNCGACDTVCGAPSPSTAVCKAAHCVVTLASSGGGGEGITVDATSVYWANGTSVLKVPLGGGDVSTLVAADESFQVAVNSTSVYWTSFLGVLGRVSLDGSSATTLVSTDTPTPPYFVAVDSSNVYWTTETDTTAGTVVEMSLSAAGNPTTLATGQSLSQGIGVAGGTVYWADATSTMPNIGTIMSTSAADNGAVSVFATTAGPYAVAVDATNVYWTNQVSPGVVVKAPRSGGAPVTLASNQNLPTGIAVDGENVYWADKDGDAVMKVPIGGGTPTVIASIMGPQFIAVDGTSVYCTTNTVSGNVFRITPK